MSKIVKVDRRKCEDERDTIFVSFSGGRSSAMMGRLLQKNPRYKDKNLVFVFANTGREHEETLQFVKDCDDIFGFNTVWVEADISQERGVGVKPKVVTFETATRIGEPGPFDALIQKLGIPNPAKSGHCTRDLKVRPMEKYLKSIGLTPKQYTTAIGIRADEPRRLTGPESVIYPLSDFDISELAVRQFWKRQDFDLQLPDYKGNCDLCFKKSEKKMLTCMAADPKSSEWWANKEETASLMPGKDGTLKRHRFSRAGTPASELLDIAKAGDFEPAKDKFHGIDVLGLGLAYDPSILETSKRSRKVRGKVIH